MNGAVQDSGQILERDQRRDRVAGPAVEIARSHMALEDASATWTGSAAAESFPTPGSHLIGVRFRSTSPPTIDQNASSFEDFGGSVGGRAYTARPW
jgi:hypothetical protein